MTDEKTTYCNGDMVWTNVRLRNDSYARPRIIRYVQVLEIKKWRINVLFNDGTEMWISPTNLSLNKNDL